MSRSIATPKARISFPNLDKVDRYGHYSATLLFPKGTPETMAFLKWLKENLLSEAATIKGPDQAQSFFAKYEGLKDGDNPSQFKTYRSEYAGYYVLKTKRKGEQGPPCIVDRNKQPVHASKIYGGCWVIVYLNVFAFNNQTNAGVTTAFQHVMFVEDGEPFAQGGKTVEDAFADIDLPAEGGAPAPAAQGGAWPAQQARHVTPPIGQPGHPFAQPTGQPASPFAQQPTGRPAQPAQLTAGQPSVGSDPFAGV